MRTTTRRWRIGTAAAAMVVAALACRTAAHAEGGLTLEERVQRLERRSEMPAAAAPDTSGLQSRLDALEAAIKKPPFGLTIGGMVVTSYLYDLNGPHGHDNVVGLRAFDRDHNTFDFDLFQLQVSRAPGENGIGFGTKVNFGKTAERMSSDWHGDGHPGMCSAGAGGDRTCDVDLEEAYITYNPPSLSDLQLKAGKFVTMHGAEVIESPLNPNISRSLAFTFAIPFTHTGVMLSYALSPQLKVTGGVVNGWDNVIDSNDGKSFMGSVAWAPADQFNLSVQGMYGAEQPNRGDSKRGLIDVVATVKPVENLTFLLNYDYGNETRLGPPGADGVLTKGDTTAEWNAFSGIVSYDLPDALAVPIGLAVRGEYFDDSDSTRLGGTFGQDQHVWEATATFKVVLAEGLMARAEYRYDSARRPAFLRNASIPDDEQQTVAGELSYVF